MSDSSEIDAWVNDIHCGDVRETLAEMPASSVHSVMTSPPYFGLRDYGEDGQIGLEDSLDEYIAELVTVGKELRRVLRDDGSWWLNLGDSYAGSGPNNHENTTTVGGAPDPAGANDQRGAKGDTTFPRKSKMLVPHRVAIALQDAGWVVRSDAVWSKPNPMPSPVKDRLNESKEFVFHLTPAPDYWFDLDAIREPHAESSYDRMKYGNSRSGDDSDLYGHNESGGINAAKDNKRGDYHVGGKNPGDIFEVTTKPFPETHFAVYPPELCEKPIKSSCPEKVCTECGTPHERQTSVTQLWERDPVDVERPQAKKALERFHKSDLTVEHLEACRAVGFGDGDHGDASQGSFDRVNDRQQLLAAEAEDVLGGYFREFVSSADRQPDGWDQTCDCETDETEPGIVLDPFAGAGTTCLVAKRLGRRFVGIELNEEYVAMAQKRVGITVDNPEHLLQDGETTLQSFGETATAHGGGDDE